MNIFIFTGQVIIGLVFVIAVVNDYMERNILISMADAKLTALLKRKIPNVNYLVYGAMGLKVVCGLGLIFNILPSVAAFFLAGFTIIANVVFNNFWALQGDERKGAYIKFLIHWAIIGGLIVLIGA